MKREKNDKVREVASKETEIRNLIQQLQGAGLEIRREKLRSGSGWRVLSGSCRLAEKRLLFVDRRLSQDEQLAVLREAALGLGAVKPVVLNDDGALSVTSVSF